MEEYKELEEVVWKGFFGLLIVLLLLYELFGDDIFVWGFEINWFTEFFVNWLVILLLLELLDIFVLLE